ncbi:band 4.1-like protein 4 isoform X2 [Danio rerio]|uniref:Band 4.1-like protein 4 isoform X2 n=1 Tax=Danio rerio TaxID=7955 RepID=A0A8M9QGE0_DANRE|nr:band 4.1-like protein 4 isoform X1 [Danio rerio]|eukprot:XP_021334781.1 band 4.1-like protein 4 isoform X1 [Danio rerio]
MSCFCSVQEEFYCEVLLLDESKLILTTQQQGIKKSTRGCVVMDYVFSHVNLAETEYFGLRYCDRSHQTFWLDPSKTLAEHKDLIATGPPYTLYFGVKFYAEDPGKLKEEITRYQFFLQVKQDVLQGRLPCAFNISAQLAALAIQSELGDYDPYKHTAGYVSEYRFVPDQKEDLEDSIEQIHKTLLGQVPAEAENNYLAIAKTLEMYGVDLHPVFCNETSFFFDAASKTACKNLWKCCVEHHTFFRMPENESNSLTRKLSKFSSLGSKHRYSGKTAMQIGRESTETLPRADLQVIRTRSKTYPKRSTQPAGRNNGGQAVTKMENTSEGQPKTSALTPVKSPRVKAESASVQQDKPSAPWEEDAPQSGLYNSASERNKSPKFPKAHRRSPSGGSENEPRHRRGQTPDDAQASKQHRRRSRSRGNTSSGSESENSNREHRKKRNRSRQENEMVDSAPQWEVVLRRQKEKTPNDPNQRRSRHRSRSRSPDVQAKEQLWKHIQKELVDPSGLSEEQLKEIPYKKVETQGDPIKIRHSHSPRSFRQYRRSHCSDGERSVLSEVNSRTDLVPPLAVTRTADVPGSSSTPAQKKKGSKDTLSESSEQDTKSSAKVVKTVHTSRMKAET